MASYASLTGTTYASRTNTVLTPPAGLVDNDELILYFLIAGATLATVPTVTFPSGFAIIGGPVSISQNNDAAQGTVRSWVLRKRASSESGSYTITHAAANADGVLVRVTSGANAVPSVSTNSAIGNGNITFNSVTTTGANACLLAFCHNWQLWGAGDPPAGTTPTFTERQDSATSLIHFSEGTWTGSGASGAKTKDSDNTAATDGWASMLVAIENAVAITSEQEGYRWRNDDGSEATATYMAAQDTTINLPAGQRARLRFLVNSTGDRPTGRFQLQYRKVGDASWRDLDTSG